MITHKMLLETTRDLNVLYVEDDAELLLATKDFLSIYFKSVTTAQNGREGLDKFISYEKDFGDFFDIVITDIKMPELDGIEMSQEILELNETQSILVITAFNTLEYLFKLISMGIDGYLLKPLDHQQFFKNIFRVSRSISDHKMIDSYVKTVEDLNLELYESNATLKQKNEELEKSSRMLDTVIHKNEIIQSSTKNIEVKSIDEEELRKNEDIKNQIVQLVNDDLFELRELLNEIDVCIIEIINDTQNITSTKIEFLIKHFARYAAILNFYTFFNELSLAMSNFAQTMRGTPLPENPEVRNNVFTFLETFVYVLSKWQDGLAIGEESSLNQLDASIISDMHTIINMWTEVEAAYQEEDLDDIFDF